MPAILDRCVAKLKAQGKSDSSAYAICTKTLKKSGKLDENFFDKLDGVEEGTFEFEEFQTYLDKNALSSWSPPAERTSLPDSHFFDSKNKQYPYRNCDGSFSFSGVMAAWKTASENSKTDPSILSRIQSYRDKCLKSQSKSYSQPSHQVSFPILDSSLKSVELSKDKNSIDIQILRMGKFKHPWWGVLRFDKECFNSFIKNFEAGIPQPEIAFDFKHNPDWGAASWMDKLFIEKTFLMATTTLTEKGKESIKKKEFKFFSVEYTDDYIEYQFSEEPDENGKIVEKEFKISHGPTILGGGLTNRPFIKGMKPVSLSEDGTVIELEEINEIDNKTSKEVNESMKKTLEELQTEHDALKVRITELEEDKEEGGKKELSELKVQLDDLSAQIEKLSDQKGDNEDDERALEDLKAAKKELEDTKKELDDMKRDKDGDKAEITKLSGDLKSLGKTVKSLMSSKEVLENERYGDKVNLKLEEFRKKGAFPSTIEVIKSVAFSEEAKGFSITLSEGEGDDKKDAVKSFLDIIDSVLESIPEDHRFSTEDESRSIISPTGDKGMSVEEVEKYAKDKEISLEEAMIELDKKGKLKD